MEQRDYTDEEADALREGDRQTRPVPLWPQIERHILRMGGINAHKAGTDAHAIPGGLGRVTKGAAPDNVLFTLAGSGIIPEGVGENYWRENRAGDVLNELLEREHREYQAAPAALRLKAHALVAGRQRERAEARKTRFLHMTDRAIKREQDRHRLKQHAEARRRGIAIAFYTDEDGEVHPITSSKEG